MSIKFITPKTTIQRRSSKSRVINISVIIPTFNRCSQLKRALQSVLHQSLQPFEIIVIDDGSTDDTSLMLSEEFPQIKTLYQTNQGVSGARNKGIQASTGDWVALLDSDDEWLPTKLAQQVSALKQQPHYKICHTEEIWIRNGVRVNLNKQYQKKGGWIFNDCLPLCAISPSTVMIHRSIFNEVGIFDPELPVCEDYDLWLRISAKYPVLLITDPQIKKYGGHADQLSQQLWGMDRFRIQALKKIIESRQLSPEQQQATTEMLVKKASIYLMGANKRGKADEVDHYQQLIAQHQVDYTTAF